MVDVGGSVLTLRQEGKEFGQCSSTLGVINTRETSRTRRVMWSRSTDGPPGLRMKSGTTGSVSSRSDHSAASSHSTPPPATMVFIITMWENMSFCFASASGTSSRTPSTERKYQGFDFGLGLKKQDYQFVPALPRGAGDLQIELARMFIYDGFASCVRRK